jgi:phosphoglycerate dehydrogenase-like enzyme
LIVTSKVTVDEELFDSAHDLSLVITTTSGFDHIDLAAARRAGVAIGRCPLARRDAVVEATVAMASSLFRAQGELHRISLAGDWGRKTLPLQNIRLIRGSVVGIVGMGVIGRAARRVWTGLGAEVIWCDPEVDGGSTLEELLGVADIVSIHCSLSETSEGLIDERSLSLMKPGAILINTARGGCVDLPALMRADHLGGFGLDVFPSEPPVELAKLALTKNSVITPHSAGFHVGLGASVAAEVVETVRCWRAKEPLPHPL